MWEIYLTLENIPSAISEEPVKLLELKLIIDNIVNSKILKMMT